MMAKCEHKEIVLFGSEETGLRRIECGSCGITMKRRVVDGEYCYFPTEDEEEE